MISHSWSAYFTNVKFVNPKGMIYFKDINTREGPYIQAIIRYTHEHYGY